MPIDLDTLATQVPRPDESARAAATTALTRLAKPDGALGRLEDLAIWLAGCQGHAKVQPLQRPHVIVFAGDHGVAADGVSAFSPEVTALMVRTFVSGGAAVNVLARLVGAQVQVVDLAVAAELGDLPEDVRAYKVRAGSGRINIEDALTAEEAEQAFRAGQRLADDAVDAGADLLIPGDMGIGNTTPATALIAVLTGLELVPLVGRGTGVDDRGWMRKTAVIRDAARRGRPRKNDPLDLLAAIGGADIAAMTGFLVQAAIRRTPVVLDGIVSGAAALVAHRITYRCARWWVAGHRSAEPAHAVALERLGLLPVIDLQMRLGEGTGALMAVPVLVAASRLLDEMTTLESVLMGRGDP